MKMLDRIKNAANSRKDTKFYFFSGKGGVGKTSVASATALWMARKGRKTLIISTDPAHSLSDSFGRKIGGEVQKIAKNLYAVEIDPKKAMEEYKEKFMPEIERMDFLKGLGLDETFDIAGMTPGIDEVASFDKFLGYMNSREYDVIIFDTAPTGHALRFLSLPDVLDSWIGKMIRIRMKFSGIANMFRKFLPFGSEEEQSIGTEHLDEMKRRIEEAKKILTDPEKTSYNIVMVAEAMSIYESERSLETLNEYGIPVKAVIVNQIVPENGKCEFCAARRKQQLSRLEYIRKRFGKYRIIQVPLFKEEVHGIRALEKMGKHIYGSSSS